jgi:NAD(P)H-dependent flavin oxidoreductase YrpB (nitropropane dioxygenase family)
MGPPSGGGAGDAAASLAAPVPHPALQTALCELVGVKYPVVQTGMGWVAGPRLVSATANAGGLGILAAATMDGEQLALAITEVKGRTDKPFGVNLRADAPDIGERLDLLISEGVKVGSFALAPKPDLIRKLRDNGVVVIPSIGARRHAQKVAEWGVDAVLVHGGEGGGHTGDVPTTLLLPQVVDAIAETGTGIPVVGAGGFFDGRGLVAALSYGAAGVAMGTRFLLTRDSTVSQAVKEIYLGKSVSDTLRTTQVDGVPHRVLRTDFTEKLDRTSKLRSLPRAIRNAVAFHGVSGRSYGEMLSEGRAMKHGGELSWSQIVMAANTPMLLKASMVDGNPDLGVMSSGQVVGMIDDLPTVEELIHRIVRQANEILDRFAPA